MAKTLNQFLEGYLKVKNPDEQKFVDKHVVAKHADRNGNGDEVFKGSKVKMDDRRKTRHGYNPGEDEKVYESSNPYRDTFGPGGTVQQKQAAKNWLTPDDTGSEAKARTPEQHKKRHAEILSVGNNKNATIAHLGKLAAHSYKIYHDLKEALTDSQHKIDANKNGKVDAHDFKLLRSKKKKVDETVDDPKLAFQLHMAKKKEELRKKGQLAKEEVQIDELSTDTMKSYGDKRARTVFSGGRKPGESVDAAINRKSKQSNSLSLARTKINRARDTGSTVLNKEQIEEKLNMDKASMGDVITDFKDSNAPQFKGKSQDKRRAMAIAAKLTAERGGKPLRKEEKLADLLGDLTESHRRTMLSVFDKLNEDNQKKFLEACKTPEGVDSMLDFAISHRGE